MDWFSWLSKTNLEPSLVHEYSLAFVHNELQEGDLAYFNHEFLQSMGISIAKHRLEILKLVTKEKGHNPHPMNKILITIKLTKSRFSKYLRRWTCREESAVVLVSKTSHSARWKNSMIKKKKKLMVDRSKRYREPLLLTNGSPMFFPSSRINSFSSPVVQEFQRDGLKMDGDCYYDEYWPCAIEEVKWDAMFHNLKPT
ncbi:hypothetical protein CDL12_23880 [Handroanthus impetiginosus]|uniref:Uncharacterized protein n=1 Tax=Handroanthus impetiginosus TaxID=429701 RepID=A0A2G9GEF2_9LAMI|nr:hypothetical protein CDL12_23880 [Handroanthus impetiginosus]